MKDHQILAAALIAWAVLVAVWSERHAIARKLRTMRAEALDYQAMLRRQEAAEWRARRAGWRA